MWPLECENKIVDGRLTMNNGHSRITKAHTELCSGELNNDIKSHVLSNFIFHQLNSVHLHKCVLMLMQVAQKERNPFPGMPVIQFRRDF